MILSNQVRCNTCGDTPFSGHVHDFRYCKCGAIAVDGGMQYLRRLGNIHGGYTDLSIDLPDAIVKLAVKQADEAIEANSTPRLILLIVMGTFLAGGISYAPEDSDLDALYDAGYDGAKWASGNGRNGLGYVCAIARYIRDAGGVWTSPESLNG